MMKRKLMIWLAFSMLWISLPAQTTRNAQVLEAFSDSLRNLSASYYAYYRIWEDLSVPVPRSIRLHTDYYKFIVPPTYYTAPIEQAFSLDWEPGKKLVMSPSDSIYACKPDTFKKFELPQMERTDKVDRWINKILLNYYLSNPGKIVANELYFADVKVVDESLFRPVPREEKMKDYMKVENPADNTDVDKEVVVLKPNFWKYKGNSSLQLSQYSISDNWYQGGESTNALLGELRLSANYNDQHRVEFENMLELKVGFITAPSDTMHSYRTNADLFRLNSKLGVRAIKNLYYTIAGEFKTQFFPNYKTNSNDMISNFFSPAQLAVSVGMDYKLSKKKYNLSIMGAPFSYTFVYIANDSIVDPTAFSVERGKKTASLFGSKITANLDWKITSNISYLTKLEYFTTYDKVIVSWENTFDLKLNRYLSTRIFIHPRFDDGVTLTPDNDSYFQFKEMLTFGLAYSW